MKIREGFAVREVAGKTVAISVDVIDGGFQGMVTLNSTGKFIWELLEKGAQREDVYDALVKNYDVSIEDAKKDADAFIDKLIDGGIIED